MTVPSLKATFDQSYKTPSVQTKIKGSSQQFQIIESQTRKPIDFYNFKWNSSKSL